VKKLDEYSVRKISSLKDMLSQSTELYANENAFLVKISDDNYKGIKYSEFKNDVDALGTALFDMGLKNGYIAVMGENRYEWCVTYLSVVNGTGVIVPIDKELPSSEKSNLLKRSGAGAIIFSGKYHAEMEKIRKEHKSLKYYIDMDLDNDEDGFLSYKNIIEKGRHLLESGNRDYLDLEPDPEGLSILLFTSGTTDLAKGVMLSHKNICSNIMAVSRVMYIDHMDSVLSILPLHHTYECTCGFLAMIYNGCCIAFNEGLKHIGKNLKETKPSILLAVPLIIEGMYKKIWEQAGKKKGMKTKLKVALFISGVLYSLFGVDIRRKLFKPIHDNVGGRIRLVVSGAAAINPDVSKGFRKMGIKVIQGYGLTECSPIVTCNRDNYLKDASIGLALPDVEIKIADADTNGIGELVTRGDNVMLGYFENTLATEKILKDGWLYTGDLGHVDREGFYYITGRKKNVIVTKNGKNIFPEEVEAYLNKSEFIMESIAYGTDDKASGETIVNALIVPDIEAIKEKHNVDKISENDIYNIINAEVRFVNRAMPLYKRVMGFKIHKDEFEKTTTKKIKRYVEKT